MRCPNCGTLIAGSELLSAAASILGARGRGKAKARDPKKMSAAGKKGGWPKGKPRKKP